MDARLRNKLTRQRPGPATSASRAQANRLMPMRNEVAHRVPRSWHVACPETSPNPMISGDFGEKACGGEEQGCARRRALLRNASFQANALLQYCPGRIEPLLNPDTGASSTTLRKDFLQCGQIDRFDEMIIEPGFPRSAAIFFLSVAGYGSQRNGLHAGLLL